MPNLRLVNLSAALLITSASALAQQWPWLGAPVLLDGLTGYLMLQGDVDGDGDVDAIAFTGRTSTSLQDGLTVMLNDGSGRLQAGQSIALVDGAATDARLGDVDGDGRADIVMETLGSSAIGAGLLILPGLPGGTFGAHVHVPLPGNVLSLRLGDGNGDGVTDVFVSHGEATWPGSDRWVFGAPGFAMTLGAATPAPNYGDRLVLEATGDGVDDVVIVDDQNGLLRVLETTPTGLVQVASTVIGASFGSQSAVLDVDGDGDLDVLRSVTGGSTLTWTVAFNNGGAWSSSSMAFTGVGYGFLWPGDWDGDGDLDVMLRGSTSGLSGNPYHTVTLFEGDGLGGFEPRYYLLLRNQAVGLGAGMCDLNGDGDLDFVDGNAIVFGDGTMDAPFQSAGDGSFVDWDRDGDLDRFYFDLERHDGGLSFSTEAVTLPDFGNAQLVNQMVLDLEGDGRHEMLLSVLALQFPFGWVETGTRLLREGDDLVFSDAGLAVAPGVTMGTGIVDDADDDGDLDVVNAQGVWLNDGSGFFTLQGPSFGSYIPVAKGDVDGDGDMDMLGSWRHGGTSVAVFYRTGPASYAPTVLFPSSDNVVQAPQQLEFQDIDDDGDLDVVAREQLPYAPDQTLVFTNQGGVFTLAMTLPESGKALAADVDGDGLTDLAIVDNNRLFVRRRVGPGLTYEPTVVFACPAISGVADIDQDGDADFIGYDILQNRTFHGVDKGVRRQYGQGAAGQGGRRPVLSFVGALRENETPSLRLRNAPGGTFVILVLGSGPNDAPSLFLPGVQSYVAPVDVLVTMQAGGPLGVDGAGELDVPLPLPPGLAGAQLYWEFVVFDTSVPFSLTHSNGCETVIGQ